MKTSWFLFAVAALAIPLHAADGPRPARPQVGGSPDGQAFERLLTDEQRQEVREFIQAEGTPFRENQSKVMQLRRELQEVAVNGAATAKFIKEKADEIARLEADQLRVRTLALAKVARSFTPEQRAQVKAMTDRMNAVRRPLGGGERESELPRRREDAAPPPPEK